MILVDTSVWIRHFAQRSSSIDVARRKEGILTHPLVIGELACGLVSNRRQHLADLFLLPRAIDVPNVQVQTFIEQERLWGKGIGILDAHLLASAVQTGCTLWTFDAALERAAARLRLTYTPRR